MKTKILALLVTCIASGAAAQTTPTIYHNLTLIDPVAQTRTPDAYIVIEGKHIVAVGQGENSPTFADAQLVDMRGAFAMPGLIDTHAHITVGPLRITKGERGPKAVMEGSEAMTRHDALMLLAHGVTTIRDPGGDARRMVAYRDAVEEGSLLGPQARVAGGVIDRPPFPALGLVDAVAPDRSVADVVRAQAAAGVDWIKLYEGLTEDDLREGIAAADSVGLPTVAHLSDVSWTKAPSLGIDSIVHAMPLSPDLLSPDARARFLASKRPGGWDFYRWWEEADLDGPLMQEMIAALAERQVPVDLTMIVFRQAFWGDDLTVRNAGLENANPTLAENWTSSFRFDAGWEAEDYRRARAVWPKLLRFARMLHEAGVPLTIGTDMNNPFTPPGSSMADEMALHADAGIENWAILRMATANGARLLGLDDRTGRIAAEMEADIVFLGRDPSRDISATREVVAVINDGILHSPTRLRAAADRAVEHGPCARCTPDNVVSTLYDAISIRAGEERDWQLIETLVAEGAPFAAIAPGPKRGARLIDLTTLKDHTETVFGSGPFSEQELSRTTTRIGEIASIESRYFISTHQDGVTPEWCGTNFFQLAQEDAGWLIVANTSTLIAASEDEACLGPSP